jgi:hypothetical protein
MHQLVFTLVAAMIDEFCFRKARRRSLEVKSKKVVEALETQILNAFR